MRWVSGENHNDVTKRSIPDAFCEQVLIDIEKAELRDAILNGFARRGVYSHREIQNWRTFLLRTIGAFDDLSAIEGQLAVLTLVEFDLFPFLVHLIGLCHQFDCLCREVSAVLTHAVRSVRAALSFDASGFDTVQGSRSQ